MLKKETQSPAEFVEDPKDLRTGPGSVWLLEIDQEIPKISSPNEKPPTAVFLRNPDPELYKRVVTEIHPDFILLSNEKDQLAELIEKLESQLFIRNKKRQSRRTASDRNKELQTLAQNLERLVEERTQWIESSNREQRELIRNERRFVQFLIEIGLQYSQEDLLEAFLQEFRQMRLGQEIYLIRQKKQEVSLMFLKQNEIHKMSVPEVWWTSQEVETLPEIAVRRLAKEFSRPVGKLTVFPLPALQDRTHEEGIAGLLIERGSTGPIGESEYAQIKKYVQALGLSLERMRLEDDNRLSALLWERVFDAAQDPIAIISEKFNVIRSNQIFGDPHPEKKCYQIWAGRNTPCLNCPIVEGAQTAQEVNNNERFYQVVSRSLNSDENVYLHRYVNVTEVRKAHIHFIQNEKLTSIGQIAEQMAHEIYNPLAGIIALVQILLEEPDQLPTTKSDLEEIKKAAVRAQKVIENLQDFVKQEGDITATSIDEIVEKTLPLLKMKWRAFRLNLGMNTPQIKLKVQPQLISQVIYNLIQNACQAMKSGQSLTISSEVKGSYVQLRVQDQGAGIPFELQSSVFKPFFTTKPTGEGTGLGLSLSKQIVERFNGRLYFESQPGVGTTFFLELPFERTH